MADNATANPGAGGPVFRTLDDGTAGWQGVVVSYATTVSPGANVLQPVTPAFGLPVAQQGSWSFTLSGSAAVTGPLTDTQLRAAAVPVSGPLTDTQLRAAAVPVSGPLTDTELRASAVPVSAASLPLPTGAATETTLAALNTKTPALGQAAMASSSPVAIASNQSPVPVLETATVIDGAAAQTAVVSNILPVTSGATATSSENFRAASVQVVSTGTAGTFIFEQSNDNVNFVALPVFNAALVTGVPITAAITATASSIIYTFPIRARFIRLRIATLITGGSIQAFTRLSSEPWTAAAQLVASNAAANMLVQATVTSTRITPNAADGHSTTLHLISAATTNGTVVKASAGAIGQIVVSNNAATASYFKLYNSTTVTVGTTTPVLTALVPAGGTVVLGGNSPIRCSAGICFGLTKGIAVADTAAVGASEMSVSIFYT